MAEIDFPPSLADAQIRFFDERGYLSIDRITSDSEVEALRRLYDGVLADPRAIQARYETGPNGAEGIIQQVFSPELLRPELLQTGYMRNAQRLAASLLGVDVAEVHYGGLLLIYKPAAGGRDTPWHQDEAYWDFPTQRCHSLSVWMPLDDVTVDSGCMQFLPRSHRERDVLRYRKPPGPNPLVLDEEVDLSSAVPCPIPAGGATFHHCRTLHYTGPNTSPRPRRALTTIFHGPRKPRETPLARTWMEAHGL
jgi:ectoine hydroxylase-related dioxygenase (phytanoyl-CoA dioxygenase family)